MILFIYSCSSKRDASQLLFDLISRSATMQNYFLPTFAEDLWEFFQLLLLYLNKITTQPWGPAFFSGNYSKSIKLLNKSAPSSRLLRICMDAIWFSNNLAMCVLPDIFACATGWQSQLNIWGFWLFELQLGSDFSFLLFTMFLLDLERGGSCWIKFLLCYNIGKS